MNFPWAVVERGGQARGRRPGRPPTTARLKALVDRAHASGLWIRFYTLNGHSEAESQGWSAGYNFGSIEAARERFRAAIAAGVDFIASDQYEALSAVLPTPRAQAAAQLRWYKGNTHTHTLNSDGDSTPDEVARWYREHGYQFLVLSDHNFLTERRRPQRAASGRTRGSC